MNNCTKCGAVNNVDSKFCYACGNRLTTSEPAMPQQPAQSNIPMQQESTQTPSHQPVQQSPTAPPVQGVPQPSPVPPAPASPAMQPNQQPFSQVPTPPTSMPQPNAYPPPMAQQIPAAPYGQAPYTPPTRSGKHPVVLLLSLIGGIIALISLIMTLTPLGSSLLGMLGMGKAAQFDKYFFQVHSPIYKVESAIALDLNDTLFYNDNPDYNYVYQKSKEWKRELEKVLDDYLYAGRKLNDELLPINDLSVWRSMAMIEAMELLMLAIDNQDPYVINNEFIPKIDEYNRLYEQFKSKILELSKKYDIPITFEQI